MDASSILRNLQNASYNHHQSPPPQAPPPPPPQHQTPPQQPPPNISTDMNQLLARLQSPAGGSVSPSGGGSTSFTAPNPQHIGAPSFVGGGQTASSLLDFLQGGGRNGPISPPANGLPSFGLGRGMNGSGVEGLPPMQQMRSNDMHPSLMGGLTPGGTPPIPVDATSPKPTLPHHEPLIDHTTSPPQPDSIPVPKPSSKAPATTAISSSSSSKPSPSPVPAQAVADSAVTPPPAAAPAQANKFKFISPFDAFEELQQPTPASASSPKPKEEQTSKPTKTTGEPKASSSKLPQQPAAKSSVAPVARSNSPHVNGNGKNKAASPASPPPTQKSKPATPKPVEVAAASHSRSTSAAGSPSTTTATTKKSKKVEEVVLQWKAQQFIQKGQSTSIKEIKEKNLVIDITEPNSEGLVHDPSSALKERKISAVKTDVLQVGMSDKKVLAVSTTSVAYILSKGAIRVLDIASGATTLIEPESKPVQVDVNGGMVAAVLADSSVTIWKLSVEEDEDAPGGVSIDATVVGKLAPAAPAVGAIQQVSWVSSVGTGSGLMIRSEKRVAKLKVDENGHILGYDGGGKAGKNSTSAAKMEVKSDTKLITLAIDPRGRFLTLAEGGIISEYNSNTFALLRSAKLPSASQQEWTEGEASSIIALPDGFLIRYPQGLSFVRYQWLTGPLLELGYLAFRNSNVPEILMQADLADARYDFQSNILWVSSLLRSSLFAIKLSDNNYTAFAGLLEFPLEPIGDFCLIKGQDGAFEVWYKYNRGFSSAAPDAELLASLAATKSVEAPKEEEPAPQPTSQPEVIPAASVPPPAEALPKPTLSREKSVDAVEKAPVEVSAAEEAPTVEEATKAVVEDVKPSTRELQEADSRFLRSPGPEPFDMSALLSLENKLVGRFSEIFKTTLETELSAFEKKINTSIEQVQSKSAAKDLERQQELITAVTKALDENVNSVLKQTVQKELRLIVKPIVEEVVREELKATIAGQVAELVKKATLSVSF